MAHQGNPELKEKFCCMICLDLLGDPVILPCGHNYCKNCIERWWNEKEPSDTYSCPACRRSDRSRPNLMKLFCRTHQTCICGLYTLKFKESAPCFFRDLTAAVAEAGGKLKRFVHEETMKTSVMEMELNVVMSPAEPKSRADFLQRSHPVSLNPNTAHRKLLLSLGNKRVTRTNKFISPLHPDRFTEWTQALSTESFTGCCYWEVKRTGRVTIAVAYSRMSRTGRQSEFGSNKESWALECYRDCFVFGHDGVKTCVSGPQSSTVGVYLDHTAGSLSFFSVSDSMELLHRVQTTFTQPLHAGLWVVFSLDLN
uniref:Uncharacterized protein n=1 Tax=Xiphophorus maculatus TaxID=8083 RepID=A0A3B5R2H8_XIPMA